KISVNPTNNLDSVNKGDLILTVKSGAFISGNKIYMTDAGLATVDIVLIKALDSNYNPVKITSSANVIARKPEVASVYYTVTKDDGVYFKSTEKANTKHYLVKGDSTNISFEALVQMSDGSFKTLPELGYTVESVTEINLVVSGTTSSGGVRLSAVSPGSGILLIKDSTGNIKAECPVEVRAEKRPNSIVLAINKPTLNTNVAVGDSIIIAATVKDQYGDVIENPSLLIEQKAATVSATGTVALGSFVDGKLVINGSSVNLVNANGGVIVLTVTSADNTSLKQDISFGVRDVPYFSTETYNRTVEVEGSRLIDTKLSISDQDSESTFVYIKYSKDEFFVKEETGKLLTQAPNPSWKASDLGLTPGTSGLFFTIWNGTSFISGSTSHIIIDSNNIEFKPITLGSKLPKGTYVVTYYSISATDSSSIPTPIGSVNITVEDREPVFEYRMIADTATVTGTWGDKLSKFYEFTWDGEVIPSTAIINADTTVSATSGKTVVYSVTFQFINALYGPVTVTKELNHGNGDNLIMIK
ncbi:MAG: hypothetical protein K6E62_14310, partial [Lachnospiraceae bacterium]|nr:hypothetical protein [Lachnospiraceae bacterium]